MNGLYTFWATPANGCSFSRDVLIEHHEVTKSQLCSAPEDRKGRCRALPELKILGDRVATSRFDQGTRRYQATGVPRESGSTTQQGCPAPCIRFPCHVGDTLRAAPPWQPQLDPEWTKIPVAQFRYAVESSLWTVYWADRNSRWREDYETQPSHNLEDLIAEVADDVTGISWG